MANNPMPAPASDADRRSKDSRTPPDHRHRPTRGSAGKPGSGMTEGGIEWRTILCRLPPPMHRHEIHHAHVGVGRSSRSAAWREAVEEVFPRSLFPGPEDQAQKL